MYYRQKYRDAFGIAILLLLFRLTILFPHLHPVADPGIAGGGGVLSRASMEGPKVPSEAREARASRGGVWGGAP